MTTLRSTKHIDGLRGVAILLVLVDHIAWHSSARPADATLGISSVSWSAALWHMALEGSHGVDLFFVISGFCLSFPFLANYARTNDLGMDIPSFFSKRIVRIVPPYYAALLIFGLPRMLQHYASISDIVQQALFLTLKTSSVNEAFWTLAVEFRWYLLFPLVLWLFARSRVTFWTVFFLAVVCFNFHLLPFVDVGTLPAFMLGIVAADLFLGRRTIGAWAPIAPIVLACIGLVAESKFTNGGGVLPQATFDQTQIAWQLAAFSLVLAVGQSARLQTIMASRLLGLVGLASYSIYLTHAPIVGGLSNVVSHANVGYFGFISIVVALAVGFAFWPYFERPFTQTELRLLLINALNGVLRKVARTCKELALRLLYSPGSA